MKINLIPWYLKPILFFMPSKVNIVRDPKHGTFSLVEFKKFKEVIYLYKAEEFTEEEIKMGVVDDRVKQSTNNW